jgi:hypothetical protein
VDDEALYVGQPTSHAMISKEKRLV